MWVWKSVGRGVKNVLGCGGRCGEMGRTVLRCGERCG